MGGLAVRLSVVNQQSFKLGNASHGSDECEPSALVAATSLPSISDRMRDDLSGFIAYERCAQDLVRVVVYYHAVKPNSCPPRSRVQSVTSGEWQSGH